MSTHGYTVMARAQALDPEEERLRSSMDNCVNRAVSGKRLALFAEKLSFYKYSDPGVVDELVKGASLTGDVPETGMLPFKFTPAVLMVDALKVHSALRRSHLFSQAKGLAMVKWTRRSGARPLKKETRVG